MKIRKVRKRHSPEEPGDERTKCHVGFWMGPWTKRRHEGETKEACVRRGLAPRAMSQRGSLILIRTEERH